MLEVRPVSNTVVVGPKEALAVKEIAGFSYTWAGRAPETPEVPFACHVQIRAHSELEPAIAQIVPGEDGRLECKILPEAPLTGVAPGQTAVIYLGTRVLGQCTIDRTVSAVPLPADAAAASVSTAPATTPAVPVSAATVNA